MSADETEKLPKKNGSIKDNLNIVALAAALVTSGGGVLSSRDVANKLDALNVALIKLEERFSAADKLSVAKEARDIRQDEALSEIEKQLTRLQTLLEAKGSPK